jgi:hypothetical protein
MQTIRVLFTTRRFNPVSLLIRFMVPQSRLVLALASHCVIVDGDQGIEASMLHGVRRGALADILAGSIVVATVDYQVEDAEAGLAWARGEAGRRARYDFGGAFGLLEPGRDWQDPIAWFCFELAAMALEKAGRRLFRNAAHVTASHLLAVVP